MSMTGFHELWTCVVDQGRCGDVKTLANLTVGLPVQVRTRSNDDEGGQAVQNIAGLLSFRTDCDTQSPVASQAGLHLYAF